MDMHLPSLRTRSLHQANEDILLVTQYAHVRLSTLHPLYVNGTGRYLLYRGCKCMKVSWWLAMCPLYESVRYLEVPPYCTGWDQLAYTLSVSWFASGSNCFSLFLSTPHHECCNNLFIFLTATPLMTYMTMVTLWEPPLSLNLSTSPV